MLTAEMQIVYYILNFLELLLQNSRLQYINHCIDSRFWLNFILFFILCHISNVHEVLYIQNSIDASVPVKSEKYVTVTQ